MEYNKKYIESLNQGIENSKLSMNHNEIEMQEFFNKINDEVVTLNEQNGRLFFLGNGASASFSNHMALDWSKNGKIPSFSLSDSALLTALSNDFDYTLAMVEYLKIYRLNRNDLVVTTSSSGNSMNIVNVLEFCKKNKIKTIAFSGLREDNKSKQLGYYSIYVPLKTYGLVECIHQFFHHLWLDNYMKIEEWNKEEAQNMDFKNFSL